MFSEENFAHANQFSYASNFVPGESRYLIEIALLHCIGETKLLHLCSPHRDHCFLNSYSYAGHIAAWYTGKINKIFGSLRIDFRRKHNSWDRFCGTHRLAVNHRRRDGAFNVLGQRVEQLEAIEQKEGVVITTPAKAIYVVD